MPQKKSKYWSHIKKQKQLITARLMEISLKVDDHIYKHKLISDLDAELYLAEVVSYKAQCGRDERSLQVIEKLTRCMRAIIIDHQEQRDDGHEDSNTRTGSTSPVYSMPDEDRTYLTQHDEGALNVTVPNNDVDIIDLVDSDDDQKHEGDDAIASEGSGPNVEVDLHRGMSSLSLKDAEPQDTTADVNCSQSILNNFEGVVPEIYMDKTTVDSDYVKTNIDAGNKKTVNIRQTNKEVNLSITTHNPKTPIVEQHHIGNFKSMDDSDEIIIIETYCNPKSKLIAATKQPRKVIKTTNKVLKHNSIERYNNNTPASNIISVTKGKTCHDSNKTCSINNFGHASETQPTYTFENIDQMNIITGQNVLNLNAVVPIDTHCGIENKIPSNNTPETITDQKNPAKTKKKRGPRKKVGPKNEIKPKNKRGPKRKENMKTDSKKYKSVPIYNENVENDLSWVENIRYVRGIREDENDTRLNIEDCFWNNYYLPDNWNETDFAY